MPIFRFDHAVILVDDLDRGVADYRDLGFTVTPGGTHAGGVTRNALVAFQDGAYLELLSFAGRLGWSLPWLRRLGLSGRAAGNREGMDRRFLQRAAAGEGLIDFALRPPEIAADLARACSAGLEAEGPLPGGRLRPDGEEVAWQTGMLTARDLPFLCADVTPHELRVPGGEAREHANGVTGVAGVVVAVRDLDASSARYRALLGVDPVLEPDAALSSSRSCVFPIEGAEIALASPGGADDPVRARLRSGEGPCALRLRCTGPPASLDSDRTHGARLELAAPSPEGSAG